MFSKEKNVFTVLCYKKVVESSAGWELKVLSVLNGNRFLWTGRQQTTEWGCWTMRGVKNGWEKETVLLRECLSIISQWQKLTSEERVGEIGEVWLLFVKTSFCFKGLVAEYSITLWTLRLHQLNKINLGSGNRASSKLTGNSHRKSNSVQKTERCPGNSREVLWVWQFFVSLFSLIWWKDALFLRCRQRRKVS